MPSLYNKARAQNSGKWEYFQVEQLSEQNELTESRYLNFLNKSSFRMGLYELRAGTEDTQEPHKLDEVYYVVKGNARLIAGEDTTAVQPGTIAYVKANIPHRFIDITEDLQVLVIFSKTDASESDPD